MQVKLNQKQKSALQLVLLAEKDRVKESQMINKSKIVSDIDRALNQVQYNSYITNLHGRMIKMLDILLVTAKEVAEKEDSPEFLESITELLSLTSTYLECMGKGGVDVNGNLIITNDIEKMNVFLDEFEKIEFNVKHQQCFCGKHNTRFANGMGFCQEHYDAYEAQKKSQAEARKAQLQQISEMINESTMPVVDKTA